MNPIGPPVLHRFEGGGLTGYLLLSESHIAFHTYPEHRYIALDIFPGVRQLVLRFRDQAAIPIGSGKGRSGSARSWRQASSSPLHRAASIAANANTPWGDQLIP